MTKKDSPYYCASKGCRKTVWNTPEYLTSEDWDFLKEIVRLAKGGAGQDVFDLLWEPPEKHTEAFFCRVLGWPEGHSYCRNNDYWLQTAFPGITRHSLSKLEKALKKEKAQGTSVKGV